MKVFMMTKAMDQLRERAFQRTGYLYKSPHSLEKNSTKVTLGLPLVAK